MMLWKRAIPAVAASAFSAALGCSMCDSERSAPDASPPPSTSAAPSASAPAPSISLAEKLDAARKGGRHTVRYREPSKKLEQSYREWIRTVFEAARDGRAPPAEHDRFKLEVLQPGGTIWLIREKKKRRRGSGALALRVGNAASVIIEAPHTFFDQGTLPIALAAFESHRCRALLINSVHRCNAALVQARKRGDKAPKCEPRKKSASDVAHARRSLFLVTHEQAVATYPQAAVVQFHGYRDDWVPGARIVLSAAGTEMPLETVSEPLGAVLGAPSVRTAEQVKKLGGFTNVQAQASARVGARFLHLEMSRSLRDDLLRDEAIRRRVLGALLGPLTPESESPP